MNTSSDIIRQFRKYGGESEKTVLINDDLEQELAKKGILGELPGKPLIISEINKGARTIITSTHVGVWHDDWIDIIPLDEVIDATVDLNSFRSGGPNLNNWTELLLVTKKGSYRLIIESGEPYSGVWNALKWIAAYNIRNQR